MGKVKREYIKMFATAVGLGKFLTEVDMETKENGIHLVGKRSFLQKCKCCSVWYIVNGFSKKRKKATRKSNFSKNI